MSFRIRFILIAYHLGEQSAKTSYWQKESTKEILFILFGWQLIKYSKNTERQLKKIVTSVRNSCASWPP
jgi:hypothetical protein